MAHVALVEDNGTIRRSIERCLQKRGHDVTSFETFRSALSGLTKLIPDLLLTDVHLPDGTGLELIARLRHAHPDPFPIMILSGRGGEDDILSGYEAGADDYLLKPFSVDELLAKCEVQLKRHSLDDTRLLGPPIGAAQATTFGRYRLEQILGHGGYGTVYRAFDTRTERGVALKIQNGITGEMTEMQLRFMREAYSLSSVDHPQVVRVLDFGIRNGQLYYAMEDVVGPTLMQEVAVCGPGQPEQVFALLEGLCDALGAVGDAGLVHRDLKPANIILRNGHWDDPVLLDFGLAKRGFDRGLTQEELLMGTPAFMPPETLLGADVDARGDLFALGLVGRYAATADSPFPQLCGIKLLCQMGKTPIPFPAELPPELRQVLARLTCIDPLDRPADAHAARALVLAQREQWLQDQEPVRAA